MMTKQEAEEILLRYKAGTATREEKSRLEHWYANLNQHQGEIAEEDLRKLQLESWALLKADYEQSKESKLRPGIVAISTAWKIAAAVAAITLGVWLYHISNTPRHPDTETSSAQAAVNDIAPGKNTATLTLADGRVINLDTNKTGITVDDGLVYNGQSEIASVPRNDGDVQTLVASTPRGGTYQVVLPDGSRVWLNALSSITFPTSFTGKERKVEIKGEAYLEIAHNKAKPFKVSSLGQTVEVLGTHFNVMAYPEDNVIKTTLLEGSVKIAKDGRTTLLKPGEQAQATNGNIKVTDEVDMEDVVAWKNGYFKFDENLESIMSKVARWYDVEVVYNYKPDASMQFAGKVSRSKNISALLKIIEFNGDVHFKIEGRRVVVMK